MAWYPAAEWREIPPGPADPPITPRIVVVHTMVGTMAGTEARFRDGSGIEAHFGVAADGRVWQWRDTAVQADAQAAGNGYCISVETEDGGDPARPWTFAQLRALASLLRWLGDRHQIPMRLVASTSDRGIGYHRQFAEWNPNRHACPGDVRLAQLTSELLPVLQAEETAMPLDAADVDAVADELVKRLGADATHPYTGAAIRAAVDRAAAAAAADHKATSDRLGLVADRLAALEARVAQPVDLETLAALVVGKLEIDGFPRLVITGEARPAPPA